MKNYRSLFLIGTSLLVFLNACQQPNNNNKEEPVTPKIEKKDSIHTAFQPILDSFKLRGTILIQDVKADKYYSNDFERANTGFLPASTFKIPNSLIGLATGVIDSNTVFKWDGKKRRLKTWEKDLKLREAFHASCVPCYQELARKIGVARMQEYLQKFEYGNMVVDSAYLDRFWLEGPSKISAFQQLAFLKKFYEEKLPVEVDKMRILKQLMLIDDNKEDAYKLFGKTGWVIRDSSNVGWFVGFIEKGDQLYYIASNVEPLEGFNMDDFPRARMELTLNAWKKLIK